MIGIFTEKELHSLYSFSTMHDIINFKGFIDIINKKGHAYNALNEPLINMPLYVNEYLFRTDHISIRSEVARWRLKIGK